MTRTLAFIMDPLAQIHPSADTSFAFMLAAADRGFRVVHVAPADVSLDHNQVLMQGTHVEVSDQSRPDHFRVIEPVQLRATDCAAIFIRTDPPFDTDYLTLTWLLSFAEKAGVLVINSPSGLRTANEHLYSLHFPELCPETLISNQRDEIIAFVRRLGGSAIGKPIDGHGGYGVVRLRDDDHNLRALIDLLTLEGKQPTMVQRYLPEAAQGDKRLILLNGELRGAVLRVPSAGDHRGNVHVGGTARPAELTPTDRAIAGAMRDRLVADKLYFVGLDVIGDRLIEVNVTSPTLVRELLNLGGPDLAAEVMAWVQETTS